MHEQVVAADGAYVTVVEDAELENLPVEENEATAEQMTAEMAAVNPEEQMEMLMGRVLQALQQIHESGDSFVAIAVNPELIEAFTAAFRGLSEETIAPHVRDNLPIVPEPGVSPLKIITGREVEIQFFQQRYGPRENGGNGLIQALQAAVERDRSPVPITPEFLRFYYLLDMANKVLPKIYEPTGAEVRHLLTAR